MSDDPTVLVIGGGLAGLSAALAATSAGARVTLVCAGRLGVGGDSAIASGGLAVADVDGGDSPEAHAADTLRSGHGLSAPEIVAAVTRGAPALLDRLRRIGADVATGPDGRVAFAPVPGHSSPRSVRCRGGGTGALMTPLIAAVRAAGVDVVEHSFVVGLERDGGRVVGARLVDERTGVRRTVRGGAVVLAAGGLGGLFAHTSNNDDVFGSAYALALEAGCSVVDLEFVQFTPTALVAPVFAAGMSPGGALMAQPGVALRNALGERFMVRHDPERAENTTRDVLSRAIDQEVREGRGTPHGGVYLDLSGTTRERIADISGRFLRAMDEGGFDPFADMVEVAPEAHFCMGGVPIAPDGRTEVAGLYAAGEAAVGLHGANRLNSNALTEAGVIGERAGLAAAAYAVTSGAGGPRREALPPPAGAEPVGEAVWRGLRDELRAVMQAHGSVVRDAAGLREGIRRVEDLERGLPGGETGWRDDLRRTQLRQMCLVARALLLAAERRTESRGSHYRTDHPGAGAPGHHRVQATRERVLRLEPLEAGSTARLVAEEQGVGAFG